MLTASNRETYHAAAGWKQASENWLMVANVSGKRSTAERVQKFAPQ